MVLAYALGDALYVQLTNRCTLACRFCPKIAREDFSVGPYDLKLAREPTVEEVWSQAEALGPEEFFEVVFCGMGEPTIRLPELLEIAQRLRRCGVRRIRVNTDGLASLREGRNVAALLARSVDAVSVSINAPDAAAYAKLCPSAHGEAAWAAAKVFIGDAVAAGLQVTVTAVAMPKLDLDAVRAQARALGARFRARPFNVLGRVPS
jgi:TatD DNase family protein